jgi:hypothetical protein
MEGGSVRGGRGAADGGAADEEEACGISVA